MFHHVQGLKWLQPQKIFEHMQHQKKRNTQKENKNKRFIRDNVSIFYPRIQEEVIIRKNIARGPKGRGQYFSVLSPPLGFGGRIWTLSFTLTIFEACHKSQYRPAPCVTRPRRKRCLNIDHGCVPRALRIWPSS